MLREKKLLLVSIAICVAITVVLYFFGQTLRDIPHLPDTGASWYYWKLPFVSTAARISSWSLFAAHLVTVWYFMFRLRKDHQENPKNISKWNVGLLIVNFIFVVAHFIQTSLWYDGLAQDVSVWSSQYSVIIMLVLVLLMENGRRGLFFGKKINFVSKSAPPILKYHGIYMAWALIYTFWFHPMESTWGHLFGFFYMFLLFIQVSMAYTNIHMNPYWTFTLEIMVLFHGTMVAILQNNGIWPMFFFGFGAIFVVTQLHGLSLSKKAILSWSSLYVIAVLLVYTGLLFGVREISRIHEITWIPIIEYALVIIFAGIIAAIRQITKRKS